MWNPGPTFFGIKKHSSTIDFIAIPEQLHSVSTAGGPLRKMGRRLQLPNTKQPLDHIPVISKFYYNIPCQASPAPRIAPSEKLDKELMMSGVMQCKGRRNMMADMEAAMKNFSTTRPKDCLHLLLQTSISCDSTRSRTKLGKTLRHQEQILKLRGTVRRVEVDKARAA